MVKVLYINWGLPLEDKTYKEIGMVMVEVMPFLYKIEYADSEGAIIHINEEGEEVIKGLRDSLYYIDIWFEGEDAEEVKKERLLRWAKKKKMAK
jgi:hypothetical protein